MTRRLDVEKAIQAVGVLLRREGKKATRLRILKLLYIADRTSIQRTGSPILGSRFVAMKHGPLHSEVLDLISGSHPSEPVWSRFFSNEGRNIVLSEEPSVGKLSAHDVAILNEVVDKHFEENDWSIVDETHSFAEWKSAYPDASENTARTISLDNLIVAVGRGGDAESIKAGIADSEFYDRYFQGIAK